MKIKRYCGINYNYRPESYWVDQNIRHSILRDVKGTERRSLIDDALKKGRFDTVENELVGSGLSEDVRQTSGAIHPRFMGGEYLPGYLDGETEIGRIELQSTTSDVISIRARSEGNCLKYRVVDEYSGEFDPGLADSIEPFTLEKFITFIETTELNGLSGPISTAYND